jgi:creatine kinase
MTKDERCAMEAQLIPCFEKLIEMPEYGGKYVSITPNTPRTITQDEYQKLVDDHIMFKDMAADSYLRSAGIASHWPHGRGCYISEDREAIVWVGEEDHLRIMCMQKGTVLNDVFDRLQRLITVFESIDGIDFATSPDYGNATSGEKQIRDSGGSLDPPGPLPMHLHTAYMEYFECLPAHPLEPPG